MPAVCETNTHSRVRCLNLSDFRHIGILTLTWHAVTDLLFLILYSEAVLFSNLNRKILLFYFIIMLDAEQRNFTEWTCCHFALLFRCYELRPICASDNTAAFFGFHSRGAHYNLHQMKKSKHLVCLKAHFWDPGSAKQMLQNASFHTWRAARGTWETPRGADERFKSKSWGWNVGYFLSSRPHLSR